MSTETTTEQLVVRGPGPWLRRARLVARSRTTVIAGIAVVGIIALCLVWPLVSPYGANDVDFHRNVEGPSLDHPLGTDRFGRDMLTRLAEGGRTSLAISALALSIILVLGVAYGTVAAVAGGTVDTAMMRLLDGLFAIPRLPVAIVILVALRLNAQNVQTIALALSIMGWMLTARLVRGQVLSVKSREHVFAARAAGARWGHIARRHLIPNSAGIILVALLLELPTVVLGEAFLAVLGLGPAAPTATWGNIAQDGLHFGRLWEMFLASSVIAAFALSANILVDGLHDAFDPRRH